MRRALKVRLGADVQCDPSCFRPSQKMKLLITLKPERDESFISYIVRLTESNGYDTPSWILSLSGIDYMELQWKFTFMFSRSDGLKKLAILTGNPVSDLVSLLYLPANPIGGDVVEDEYNFYGAFLNRSVIRPHCPKVCPKCLIDSAHSLRVWDCSLVTACPIHECVLIDVCPKCKSRIKCVRNRLTVCSCGYDWRETDPEPVSQDELAVSRRVYRLCGILSAQSVSTEEESKNPFHCLRLRDFVVLMSIIAGLGGKMARATGRPAKSIKLRNKDLHKLYSRAYSVFENWPLNFHQFLHEQSRGESRLSPHDGKLDTSLKREFGSFYERLYEDLDGCQFEFMRESFAQFLTSRLKSHSQQRARTSPISSSSDPDKYISVAGARRLLKITHRAIFELIAIGEIEFVIRNQGTTLKYLLRLSDVENVKRKFERSLSTRALAKKLGVDCRVIKELAQAGLLRTRWRPAVDGYRTMKFESRSCREIIEDAQQLHEPDRIRRVFTKPSISMKPKSCVSLRGKL